jgi:hypothetical protein
MQNIDPIKQNFQNRPETLLTSKRARPEVQIPRHNIRVQSSQTKGHSKGSYYRLLQSVVVILAYYNHKLKK